MSSLPVRLWVLRLFVVALVWLLFLGVERAPQPAQATGAGPKPIAQATQPAPAPDGNGRTAAGPDAAWAVWAALSPDVQAKVDGRILEELQGKIFPAHLGSAALAEGERPVAPFAPLPRTRYLVYLADSPDLTDVEARLFASQADRRNALVETLRGAAQQSQSPVLDLLAQRSRARQGEAAPVTGYQPFFVVNAVAVEGDLGTLVALAQMSEVQRIAANYPLVPVLREQTAAAPVAQAEATGAANGEPLYEWNLERVQVDRVHRELGIRGEGAVVGGFDTGVNFRHPALLNQYRGNTGGVLDHNYNWFVPDTQLYANGNLGPSVTREPNDCAYSSHGTHTMGTMVGDPENSGPAIGMAPGARWIAVPGICGETMPGGIWDDIGGIKAFQWFLCPTDLTGDLASADCSKAPDVVNNSWGSANPVDDTFRPILQVLRAAGVAPVFAAGNPSAGLGSISAPANAPEAIAVGATDSNDIVTYFSALGPSFYPGEQKPELSAPGESVRSSVGRSEYDSYSGTSMAAPHVAGLIALLVSADLQDGERDFDVEDLERLMAISADDLGLPGADSLYGYGRINAYAAVQMGLSAGDLRGQIRDKEYGTPIPFARVEAYHSGMDKRFAAQADAGGVYSLTLPAGLYYVTLSGWGYETATVGVYQVVAGALSLNDFPLLSWPKATVSGVVRDAGGPVAGALVYAAGNPAVQQRTGADGRYQLLLPLGPEELVVEATGHRILRLPMRTPGPGAQIDLTLERSPSILLVDTSPLGGWFLGWPVYRFFTRALDDHNYQYDIWRVQYKGFADTQPGPDGSLLYGVPSAATLKQYGVVIWVQSTCNSASCGSPSTADIGADPALIEYLNSGGKLFISGQNMGEGDGESRLYDEYLQADRVSDYGGYAGEQLTSADFLSQLQISLTNGSLYGYANGYLYFSPDAVRPQPGGLAFPVLRYGYNGAAALAVAPCDADYRAVYFAAGFENIAPRAYQAQPDWTRVLDASIRWLTSQRAIDRYAVSTGQGATVRSGIAGDRVIFPFTIANLSDQTMRFSIYLENNRWPTTIRRGGAPLTGSFDLPACSHNEFTLEVEIPYNAEIGEQDQATLKGVSISHPALGPFQEVFATTHLPQWKAAPSLPVNRGGMAVFGLADSYHVVGGWVPYYYTPQGELVEGPTDLHHRYDPCRATWESRAPLPEALSYPAYGQIGERFYVAGGMRYIDRQTSFSDRLYFYDQQTDSWGEGARMPRPLSNAAGAVAGGKLYVFGGYDGLEYINTILVYDPATDQWQDLGPMIDGLGLTDAAAVTLDGKIYLAGGGAAARSFARYDPVNGNWQFLSPLNFSRVGASLVATPDGTLYLVGGAVNFNASVVERYSSLSATWSLVNFTLERIRYLSSAVYLDGSIHLAGGANYPVYNHESLRLSGAFCETGFIRPQGAAKAEGEILYTLQILPGDQDYPNVSLRAPLVPGATFAGFRQNAIGAGFSPQNGVEWQGSVAARSAPRTLSYAVRLDENAWQPGDRITHTVFLSNGVGPEITRSTAALLFAPDFSVSGKRVSHAAVAAGVPFTYSIDILSAAPVGGRVLMTDSLPASLEFVKDSLVSSAGTGNYDPSTHAVRWSGSVAEESTGFVNLEDVYVWADSLGRGTIPGPTFAWQDIRSTGQPVARGVLDVACGVSLGFDFPFFGDTFSEACIDVTGYIALGARDLPSRTDSPCPLASAQMSIPGIAGIWGSFAVNDAVYVQTFGAAPRRYTVVQWADMRYWDIWEEFFCIVRPPDTDFQIVLHEDGRIELHILRQGDAARAGSTTGLLSNSTSQSLTYQCDGSRPGRSERMAVNFLPPGGALGVAGQTVSFQVKAKPNVPVNSILTNTVSIQSGSEFYTRSVGLLVQSVDLSTSGKQANRSELLPGESVDYTIRLANRGLATAQQMRLTDTLPAGLTYAPGSLACPGGQCSESGGTITWQGALGPGGSVTLSYSATLTSVLPDKTALTNTVAIQANGVAPLRRSVTVLARSTNLSASAILFHARPTEPGERLGLTAQLRNTGVQPSTADFALTLPAELSLVNGSVRCGVGHCRVEGGRILWSGALPPRALVAVQFDAILTPGAVTGQRVRVQGELTDQTTGFVVPVAGELLVALHTLLLPVEGDGTEPPIFLPLLYALQPVPPAAEPPSPEPPSPIATPTPTPMPLFTPTPTPTPFPASPLPAATLTPTPTPLGR